MEWGGVGRWVVEGRGEEEGGERGGREEEGTEGCGWVG